MASVNLLQLGQSPKSVARDFHKLTVSRRPCSSLGRNDGYGDETPGTLDVLIGQLKADAQRLRREKALQPQQSVIADRRRLNKGRLKQDDRGKAHMGATVFRKGCR